ncbi:MAG: Modulator of FtsH protease HflK [Alphaproteobacteria bacterium MarineAlpha11_Bin1]|nr:MAG: Modulator of FtsH protease HflK [Alphaproteobacteria bacterium MarineAlpha11_Bin1]|tara:strand:+ start:6645 stop:7778 length:1134 start_codon:yes stop_codon:yes gene_type:complete
MPWKQQGGNGGGPWGSSGNGGGQGPWAGKPSGGGGNGGGPADIEELIRQGQNRVKNIIPGGLGGPRGIIIALLLVLIVWMLSGLYRVQPGENGIELLFGRYVNTTQPGLNFWAPWPIGSVQKPNVEKTNQTNIGFRSFGSVGRGDNVRDVAEESLMLTGDQNIIDIDFVVQWRIKNAPNFLFNIRDPETTVKLAAESSIREIVGQTPLEEVLATKRTEVESRTRDVLQRIMDDYKAGVFIADVKMQKVDPPQKVIDAFNDVQRARQDKERQQNEAEAYRNDIVPKAKGEASRQTEQAAAYRERLIKESDGEAKRFLSVYEAYKTGKDVTTRRLYLERMQEVLGRSEKVIVDKGQGGSGVVPYLPLPELRKRKEGGDQ